MSLSSISAGSLLDSPLASTLTASTNQAVSTGTSSVRASALNGSTSYASLDPLTQDLFSLLKALAYGDIAGAKTDLAKYKADLKAQTTAPGAGNGANGVASIDERLTSASIGGTRTVNQAQSGCQHLGFPQVRQRTGRVAGSDWLPGPERTSFGRVDQHLSIRNTWGQSQACRHF